MRQYFLITNAIIDMQSGERRVLRPQITTDDLELTRREMKEENHPCKSIRFTYEEIPSSCAK